MIRLVVILVVGVVSLSRAQGLECRRFDVIGWSDFEGALDFREGNIGFVAQGRLYVWDMTDPFSPVLISQTESSDALGGVCVQGHLAYVPGGVSLHVFDISDLSQPVELRSSWNSGAIIAIRDETLFLLDGDVEILDISIPTWIRRKGSYRSEAVLRSAVLSDQTVFVAASDGLHVVDVSNLRIPIARTIVPGVNLRTVATNGTLVSTQDSHGDLRLYEIDANGIPQVVADVELGVGGTFGRMIFRDSLLFVANGLNGLRVFDVSTPSEPVEIGQVHVPGSVTQMRLDANRALLYVDQYRTAFVDLSRIAPSAVLATLPTGGQPKALDVAGDLVLVADGPMGLAVFDVSDRANPSLIQRLMFDGECTRVAVYGTVVGVSHVTGITLLNLNDLPHMTATSVIPTIDVAWDVAIDGSLLATAERTARSRLFDISDPAAPIELGTATAFVGERFERVLLSGSTLLAATGFGQNILAFDVSDPEHPSLLSWGFGPNHPSDWVWNEGYLYVTGGSNGLSIIDYRDPANPHSLPSYGQPFGNAVHALGSRVMYDDRGLQLIDVADPGQPSYLASIPGTCTAVDFESDQMACAILNGKLVVIDLRDCPCRADLDFDEQLKFFDVQRFLNYYASGDPRADFISDGLIDFFDVQAFLSAFSAGCGAR